MIRHELHGNDDLFGSESNYSTHSEFVENLSCRVILFSENVMTSENSTVFMRASRSICESGNLLLSTSFVIASITVAMTSFVS